MIIFKDLVYNIETGAFRAKFDPKYFGPIALAGGGDTTVENETVPTGPWAPQIPYILDLFNNAQGLYNQGPPQAYGTADGAPLTPDPNAMLQASQQLGTSEVMGNVGQNNQVSNFLQQFGQQQNPGAAYGQQLQPYISQGILAQLGMGNNSLVGLGQGQLGNTNDAYNTIFGQSPGNVTAPGTQGGSADASAALSTLLGGAGNNPYLEQMVQGAMQGTYDSFNRNVLPGIRSEAGAAGQPGGTRQGIAEGIAAGDLANQERLVRENIYGNAFGEQIGAQGQALQNVLAAQQGDQSAALQASGLTNQAMQQYINSLLTGTGQVQNALQGGLGLGLEGVSSGTAQAGNLYGQGNSLQLQQTLQSLGMLPGMQSQNLAQIAGLNQLGLQQYGFDQNQIDALMNQYYYNQNSPYNLLSQYQQWVTGPYGSTVGEWGGYPGYNPGYNPYNPNRNVMNPTPNDYSEGSYNAVPNMLPPQQPRTPIPLSGPPIMGNANQQTRQNQQPGGGV